MNAIEKLKEISETLTHSGIEAAGKEAGLLIMKGLNIDMTGLYRDNPELNDRQKKAIGEMAARRGRREPLQYIVGCTYFLRLKLVVGTGVLIPRPETELMAEYAVEMIRTQNAEYRTQNSELRTQILQPEQRSTVNGQRSTILDLCTGSGCLALALAGEFPDAQVYGTDISETALNYSKKNAEINEIKNATFFKGHLFEPLNTEIPEQLFDFIISNPPYIRTDDIKGLQPEIRDWEPVGALDGGQDGLDYYREIIPAARRFLKDRGMLMFELGAGCANHVAYMMNEAGYTDVKVRKDYAGIERIIQVRWTK
ncbi:MAG TPA: peptide chain release factor N(5)-glutamine methyltransferase [Nitrospirae bacterium]|nr:release factor glutamine methyltransferase [bacterium BMS3Abin06]HDH12270.1 peptide chain release factor N(5)-glutamine methyltransferase [Nitrospirota bacterium]HDZ01146.1 peptide chain release factor N(5)-glutamine methyltransferase [Nitrospirota bacterium]